MLWNAKFQELKMQRAVSILTAIREARGYSDKRLIKTMST
jgi:hypothetical protein